MALATYILAIVCIAILYFWHEERKLLLKERQDLQDANHALVTSLLDRIQAPNYEVFKETTAPPEPVEEPVEETFVNLEDAREELMNG